jgi:hypothetical protein
MALTATAEGVALAIAPAAIVALTPKPTLM